MATLGASTSTELNKCFGKQLLISLQPVIKKRNNQINVYLKMAFLTNLSSGNWESTVLKSLHYAFQTLKKKSSGLKFLQQSGMLRSCMYREQCCVCQKSFFSHFEPKIHLFWGLSHVISRTDSRSRVRICPLKQHRRPGGSNYVSCGII